MKDIIYDLIIIGGGSAGLAAGIYAGRARLKTLILDQAAPGGQAANTAEVVNYPGIRKTSGPQLMEEMRLHAGGFGVGFETAKVEGLDGSRDVKVIRTDNGEYRSRSVIIATGAMPRRIGFPGEAEFTGRGIAYCATCDGEFFSGLDIFVVGGGFAAAEEAMYLTRFGKKVTLIVRRDRLSCARSIADKAAAHPQIEIRYNTQVVKAEGDDLLKRVTFRDTARNQEWTYQAPDEDGAFGLFVFAGYEPATAVFRDQVKLDEQGYIPTDEAMATNLPGVFAAGDLRPKVLRQIVTAVSDGAVAASSAEKYVTEQKERLGLPMFEEDIPAAEKAKKAPEAKKFLDTSLEQQLAGVFAKITRNIELVCGLEPGSDKSAEMKAFVSEAAALCPRITVRFVNKGEDSELEQLIQAKRYPFIALLDQNGAYTGVKFSGIPGGHEMNSFVLALYHLGAADGLTDEQRSKIAAIDKKVDIQVCISLSCHFCPEVVANAQSIALAGNSISAEMIDMGLYPELRKKYNIMSVPAAVYNGEKVVFGAKSLDEMVDIINEL